MKKLIFILTLSVTLIAKGASAQETRPAQYPDNRELLMFGLKAGANLSNVYDSRGGDFEADPKLGLAAGGFVSIPIMRYIGIQPEILFSQKGYQGNGSTFGNPYVYWRTSNFLDIPIYFTFKPHPVVTILGGPQYSYLMSQHDVYEDDDAIVIDETEYDNSNIRRNTFCLSGGADFNIRHVVLGLRGGWDVQNNNGDGTATVPRYKNVWYQATVGFRFY